MKKLFENSNLTTSTTTLLGGSGVIIVLLALKYANTRVQFFGGIFFGVLLIAIASACSKAYVLKIQPFTNDPLGWRKAKQTYKADEVVNGAAEKDSQP